MKNRILIALSFSLILINLSCKEEANELAIEVKLSNECTYNQRKTVDVFNEEQGVITYLKEQKIFTISGGKTSDKRLNNLLDPCNLPEEFKKDNLKVVFSGELKEVYAWEDLAGQPFKLTKLKVNENL